MKAYGGKLRNIVARYFSGSFDQDEALQEIWVHIYARKETLSPERYAEFDGWLGTLARRKCIDLLRARGRRLPTADSDDVSGFSTPNQASAYDAVAQEAIMKAVTVFKESLHGDWREFFQLHFVEGLAYAAAAERLGCNKLRCKYMKKVIAGRARKNNILLDALGRRGSDGGVDDAP